MAQSAPSLWTLRDGRAGGHDLRPGWAARHGQIRGAAGPRSGRLARTGL